MSDGKKSVEDRLNELLAESGLEPLEPVAAQKFDSYLSLILRWNARVNLTAVRDESGILSRHFVESIACARALPSGVASLLDFGSGGGFPGIPITLCRPEIAVTLAESQGKKAAFLQEAVRVLDLSAKVYGRRAELLSSRFDCVTLRAVDHMEQAVAAAAQLVLPGGRLVLMSTGSELAKLQTAAGPDYSWSRQVPLQGSQDRLLAFGERAVSLPA